MRLDGILHCRQCLGRTARALGPVRLSFASRAGTTLVALVLLVPALLGVKLLLSAGGVAAGRISRLRAVAPADAEPGPK